MTGVPTFSSYESELREQHGAPGQHIFTVSGLTGVGTSTIAAMVADEFGMDHHDAGQFFRRKAEEYGMDIREFDAKTEEIEEREGVDFDIEWDRTAMEYAFTRDDFVLEGRLAGVLLVDVAPVRIWVSCDTAVAAERIMAREDFDTLEDARSYISSRNEKVLQRYRDKYGVDPTEQRFYNVFVDNSDDTGAVRERVISKMAEHGFSPD